MSERMRVMAGVTAALAGVFYGPGWTMAMTPAEAEAAAASGQWEPAPAAKAVRDATPPAKPEGDDLTAAVVDAIGKLQPADFGKDGSPLVKPIEVLLGYDISASDRDAGWAAFQAKAAS